MTAKEMFEALNYKQTTNNHKWIEYTIANHEDKDFAYIRFSRRWKDYEVGYFDGTETNTRIANMTTIKEHEAITKQMKELGWI